ncbi:MAG TPA: rhomboid family intramembrane serine protease [Candidatus Hydrogenedens sp.]|mgnify:CR=1 FL=1|nr:rhomboid family intramembrane serine protease [Candidatus Hydrogenedens sp.]
MLPIRDINPSRTVPIVVILIIILNALIFFQYSNLSEKEIERIFFIFGIVPAHFRWVTLITHQFLHGGLLHLISNMWALWIFGDNIEDRVGHKRFLLFYLLCGISAGFIHTLTQPNSNMPCVGASGAISGVLGAYLVLYPEARILCIIPIVIYPYFTEMPALLFGFIWLILQLFNGLVVMAGNNKDVAGIAWWAHLGGFFAGIFILPLFLRNKHRDITEQDEM